MTGLEEKVFNYIQTQYEAEFLGKVVITIEGNLYITLITLNNYMIPLQIVIESETEDNFIKLIFKEIKERDLIKVGYLKLIKSSNDK